jgi:hypothetical protein
MLIALLVAAGCHRDAGQTLPWRPAPASKPAPAVKKGPTAEEQTSGMVAASSPAASPVPLGLKFDLQSRPAVGQALAIDIALLPRLSASAGTLQVNDSPGLDLGAAATEVDIPAVEPDQVYRTRITVTPNREGVLLLSLSVTVKHDEISESRAFSLPIIVQSAAEMAAAKH